jgi:hypothetical protein
VNAAIVIPATHRMFGLLSPVELLRTDVLPGVVVSLAFVAIVRLLWPPPEQVVWTAATMGILWLATTAAAAACLSRTRTLFRTRFA